VPKWHESDQKAIRRKKTPAMAKNVTSPLPMISRKVRQPLPPDGAAQRA